MRFVLSSQPAGLPVDQTQWNALVSETVGAIVLQTYRWLEYCWNTFGSRRELFTATLWADEALLDIAPLTLVWRAGPCQLQIAGFPNPDYLYFILGSGSADLSSPFVCYLYQHRNTWN